MALSLSRQSQYDYFTLIDSRLRPLGKMGIEQTPFLVPEHHGHPGTWMEAPWWDWENGSPAYRAIYWNEVTWDFDHHLWSHNWTAGTRLQMILERHKIPYTIWPSGGKGLHVHVFLEAPDRNGTDWVDVRTEIFNRISYEAHVNADPTKVYWRDGSMGSLLRIEGGVRAVRPTLQTWDDREPGGYVRSYKYWASHVPREKRVCTKPWKVNYPSNIKIWRVPKAWIPPPSTDEPRNESYTDAPLPEILKKLLEFMQRGGDLSDFGRFSVAAHLVLRGWSMDEIVPVFQNCPDYNEAVTRRRLDQIIRKRPPAPSARSILQRVGEELGIGRN
jgi:hypothetical protein